MKFPSAPREFHGLEKNKHRIYPNLGKNSLFVLFTFKMEERPG